MTSAARTVTIVSSPVASAAELRFADRDLADVLDYTFDLTNFLADAGGDTLSALPVITSQPNDMTFTNASYTPSTTTVFIGGGSLTNPITDYQVTMLALTSGGRTISRNAYLRTTKLGPNTGYGTALSIVRGPPGPAGTNGAVSPSGVFSISDVNGQVWEIQLEAGGTAQNVEHSDEYGPEYS